MQLYRERGREYTSLKEQCWGTRGIPFTIGLAFPRDTRCGKLRQDLMAISFVMACPRLKDACRFCFRLSNKPPVAAVITNPRKTLSRSVLPVKIRGTT